MIKVASVVFPFARKFMLPFFTFGNKSEGFVADAVILFVASSDWNCYSDLRSESNLDS